MKHAYATLPEGYRLVKEIDAAGDKKFGLILNLAALPLMAAAGAAAWALRFRSAEFPELFEMQPSRLIALLLVYFLGMLAYLVLHELTHGLVYKLLTGGKLRFGLSWSCAWCGVPDVYVTRRTALAALLAPLVLYSVVLILLLELSADWLAVAWLLMFAVHIGGCVGDLYCAWLLLFRLRGDVLMRDTGPKQSFYRCN